VSIRPAGSFFLCPSPLLKWSTPVDATALSVSHLEKRYGDVVAVRDASLDVQTGEIFGIIGPNGSGKTTTVGFPGCG
jgi:ABC-type glutathione transport system ATPase component